MKSHHRNTVHISNMKKFKKKNLLIFGFASLLWLIFRTGTKPSRIVYPCQRTALASSSILLGISIPIWLTSGLMKTKNMLSKKGKTIVLLIIVSSIILNCEQFLGSVQTAGNSWAQAPVNRFWNLYEPVLGRSEKVR